MPTSRLIFLNIGDIENLLVEFEDKFGFSTTEFLCNQDRRGSVSEDDILQWEALVGMKQELEQMHKEMRRQYLEELHNQVGIAEVASVEDDQVSLAA